jgi:hypothetical protein
LRDYSAGGSGLETCLRALFQSADDAKASVLHVIFEDRMHKRKHLTNESMRSWQESAMAITMDTRMQDGGLTAVQKLGLSSKREEASTASRFGIGMNSMYHLKCIAIASCRCCLPL